MLEGGVRFGGRSWNGGGRGGDSKGISVIYIFFIACR